MPKTKRARSIHGTYKHKRLCCKRNEIRLIRLKPAKAIRNAVQCDIIAVPLEHAPRFEAISYAWGDAADQRPIGVNVGQHLLVNKSLESALRYLRHQDKERLLWADAICINQKNIPEKNRAVSEMHIIYQRAETVIVWLGCPSRPWSFKPILDAINEEKSNVDDRFSWRCQVLTKPHRSARAIQGFAKLPWFYRGWVVQETCFARELVGQYGQHAIPWTQIEGMVQRLRITAESSMSGFLRPEGRLVLKLMRVVTTLRALREQHHRAQSMDLGHMIAFSRTRLTSDPRDKVFAFTNLLSTVPASLKPDYNRPKPGLFREVFRLLLGEIGLRLLAECEAATSTNLGASHCRMPSWAPDWSSTRRCEPLPGGLSRSFQGDSYRAGSGVTARFIYSADSAVLHVTGLVFDQIVFLEPRGQDMLGDFNLEKTLWQKVASASQNAAAGTLLSMFKSTSRAFAHHLVRTEHLDRTFEGKKTDDLEALRRPRWVENLQRVDGRSILLTRKGHVGWAPPASEIDDIIAVVTGCHVPLVIRRVHVEKFMDADLVVTHDASECTRPACEAEKPPFYRIIGEACQPSIQLLKSLLTTSRCSRHNGR